MDQVRAPGATGAPRKGRTTRRSVPRPPRASQRTVRKVCRSYGETRCLGVGSGSRWGSPGPDNFWELMASGTDAMGDVTGSLGREGVLSPRTGRAGENEHVWVGSSARSTSSTPTSSASRPARPPRIDPQQRLLLEVAWEALRGRGLAPAPLAGPPSGRIRRHSRQRLRRLHAGRPDRWTSTRARARPEHRGQPAVAPCLGLARPEPGGGHRLLVVAGGGAPACQSLRAARCDLALAGGVNLILSPEMTIDASPRRHDASPDGRCKTFDAAPTATCAARACGVVVLKRLVDAGPRRRSHPAR